MAESLEGGFGPSRAVTSMDDDERTPEVHSYLTDNTAHLHSSVVNRCNGCPFNFLRGILGGYQPQTIGPQCRIVHEMTVNHWEVVVVNFRKYPAILLEVRDENNLKRQTGLPMRTNCREWRLQIASLER